MINFIKMVFDIVWPRFTIDEVAVVQLEDGSLQPICRKEDLIWSDRYDAIIKVQVFNFFGFGLFPKYLEN